MSRRIASVLVLGSALLVSAGVVADVEVQTPLDLPGGRVISATQARDLVGKAHFFDMRKAVNFGKGHIEGAVALPYDQKSEKSPEFDATQDRFELAKLPADKDAPLVFYSDGPTGWKSYKAAVQAVRSGYRNVMWLRGGTAEWQAAGYPLK